MSIFDDIEIFYDEDVTDEAVLTDGRSFRCHFTASPMIGLDTIETSNPQARCMSSDVATTKKGDQLTVNSVEYYVIDKKAEFNRGETLLILSRDYNARK